jgi:hypothetical protein
MSWADFLKKEIPRVVGEFVKKVEAARANEPLPSS